MYHHQLKILIYSAHTLLSETLSRIQPLERFKHHFDWSASCSDASLSLCEIADIIILDLPLDDIPLDFNSHCRNKKVRKIFCQNAKERCGLPDSALLTEADEIWPNPLTDTLASFYFTKLMQRIKLEDDLRLTQNYLETAMDSIPDLVWFKDLRGAHLHVNNSFCEAVGKTKEDCWNRGHYYIWDLKQEEYEKGEYVCLETEEVVLQQKTTCLFDERVKSQTGLRQFKTYKSPLFDENGEVMGTVGIAHDVTDVQNLSTEFEIILESMNFAGVIIDQSGLVMNVNRKFHELFKEEAELPLGSNYLDWKKRVLQVPNVDAMGESFELEICSEGDIYSLQVNEEYLYDFFHERVGYFCIYRDITEHKKHMDLLANYQEHMEEDVRLKTKALQDVQQQMIISFADIIASRDSITGDHIKRTSTFVDIIVNSLVDNSPYKQLIDASFINHMSLAAPLHDIGKISISDEILNKPGKYLPTEYSVMKEHAALGGLILDKTLSGLEDEEYYKLARNMAIGHHERWDGTGYPNALKGMQIPLSARIMAVADVFDALVSKRPYKEPFTIDDSYEIIFAGRGTQFDPVIVDAFLRARTLIEKAI